MDKFRDEINNNVIGYEYKIGKYKCYHILKKRNEGKYGKQGNAWFLSRYYKIVSFTTKRHIKKTDAKIDDIIGNTIILEVKPHYLGDAISDITAICNSPHIEEISVVISDDYTYYNMIEKQQYLFMEGRYNKIYILIKVASEFDFDNINSIFDNLFITMVYYRYDYKYKDIVQAHFYNMMIPNNIDELIKQQKMTSYNEYIKTSL